MPEDMFTMQQEALRRAREMHSRAVPQSNYTKSPQEEAPQLPSEPFYEPTPVHQEHSSMIASLAENFMDMLFTEKDKTIILELLLLLSVEHRDNIQLCALMHLLM